MSYSEESDGSVSRLTDQVHHALKAWPRSEEQVGVARCPAIVDVMGGIGEDSGALLLTSTLSFAVFAAAWNTQDARLHVRLGRVDGSSATFETPIESIIGGHANATEIVKACKDKNAEWAAPVALVLKDAVAEHAIPSPSKGMAFVILDEFPLSADYGRRCVTAAATIHALSRLSPVTIDRMTQARIAAKAVTSQTGICAIRHTLTAISAPATSALLEIRLHPQLGCQPLELPPGIIFTGLTTRLARPTGLSRLIETKRCAEMGHRMILDLKRQDGEAVDSNSRLSAIRPTEYVDKYRNRMPSKVSYKQYSTKFGELRGLDDGVGDKTSYKVRSRAEHHIYENNRVEEFASLIMRARRSTSGQELIEAGNLMYNSHWSHSQRCGIGGKEADIIVDMIRRQGDAHGLFGAKVTANGDGGELVVLMRDHEVAHAALARAIDEAKKLCEHPIHLYSGSLPGAETFDCPPIGVDSPSMV